LTQRCISQATTHFNRGLRHLRFLVRSNPLDVVAIPLTAAVLYACGMVFMPAVGVALMAASTVIVAVKARMLNLKKSTTS
jgi:cation transport ATPase